MWSAHPPGASAENPVHLSHPPPTWCLIVDLHVTYIHISFPVPGWHFHGNRSRCWVELCVITYMPVGVHLCLHRLKPWQSPNCISAYGKVGEGLGRQEETTGRRKLNICLSLFGIPASPEGIKQSKLSVSSWIMLQSSFWGVLRGTLQGLWGVQVM